MRDHLQEEEEELKSRCVDTWMKMGVSGTCCTACKKLHRSQRLLGSSTSLNLLSSSSLDNLETLTHLISFRDFLRVLNCVFPES